jgi:hypothetical protein
MELQAKTRLNQASTAKMDNSMVTYQDPGALLGKLDIMPKDLIQVQNCQDELLGRGDQLIDQSHSDDDICSTGEGLKLGAGQRLLSVGPCAEFFRDL